MPFFETKSRSGDYSMPRGPLNSGDIVVGHSNGDPMSIRILPGGETVDINEEVLEREAAGIVFDKEGLGPFGYRRGLVWLTDDESAKLRRLHTHFVDYGTAPGAFLDSLSSLWRKTEAQAGLRDPNKWTLGRFFGYIFSVGRTEDF